MTMSSALVRQALALVDPDESTNNKRKKRAAVSGVRPEVTGQDHRHSYKKKIKYNKEQSKSKEQVTEENVKKLLALSKPIASSAISERIVERAIKGRPLIDKTVVKKDDGKSILFPEDNNQKKQSFKKFEDEYFCS